MQPSNSAWRWVVRKVLALWVHSDIKPDDAAARIAAQRRPVCYVMERESQADLAVLDIACRRLQLPLPGRGGCFALHRRGGLFRRRSVARAPRRLEQLIATAGADPGFDADLLPVAIYWGRAPHQEASLWRVLFAEDWALIGRFRKLLNILFNGRDTLVYFGAPVRLRDALEVGIGTPRTVRRILRSLRAALRAQRASTIGPDLSHRRTLVAQILRTQAVRRAVRREVLARAGERRPPTRRTLILAARRDAVEIAANYSQAFVTFMAAALGRLWNSLYDGVEFEHADQLGEVGDGVEIIYVPCHRSHMDYMLLSYVIYRKGFALPHVAAGVNLNMPVIGRFLRKGGAFFLRRTFKGDPLYAAVFAQYLGFMMARGHPLEYFIEGGRSRTGRLLTPRTGMLSMTVRSFVRHPERPVVFVPVYFGYERIVEGRTYIGELSGRPKEKESVVGVVRAFVSVLQAKFGKVHVNLGRPIPLEDVLRRHNPDWREAPPCDDDSRSGWMSDVIQDLAVAIVSGINSAASVTPVNLVALAMLATPRQALPETALAAQLELYQRLLRETPYSPLVRVTGDDAAAMIRYVEGMGMLERQKHPLGDIMRMTSQNAVLATYYRNNVLHLFAMPSLIACGFISNARLCTADLQRLVGRVYPYVGAELFLRWSEGEIGTVVETLLDSFVSLGLLQVNGDRSEWQRPAPTSPGAMRLSLLAEAMIQTLERYYLVVALLLQAGSGTIGAEALEQRCHLMAQRMSVLYGLDSPEFFDKRLFRTFIELLLQRDVLWTSAQGSLAFGSALEAVAVDAQLVLSEQIRRSILQVTLGR